MERRTPFHYTSRVLKKKSILTGIKLEKKMKFWNIPISPLTVISKLVTMKKGKFANRKCSFLWVKP